jgi:hypothetical protein
MARLDTQLSQVGEDLTVHHSSSVSVAVILTVAAQRSFAHAVRLASLLFGDDLADLSSRVVDAEWQQLRGHLPELAASVHDDERFEETVRGAAGQTVAAFLAADLVHARIETRHWPNHDLTRLVLQLAVQAGLTCELTEQIEDFLQ